MSKLSVSDILALHQAGLSDELIEKLMHEETPVAEKDPKQIEQPEQERKSASEILSAMLS